MIGQGGIMAGRTIATEIVTDLGEDEEEEEDVGSTILGNRGRMAGKREVIIKVVSSTTYRGNMTDLEDHSNYLNRTEEDGRETLEEDDSGTDVRVKSQIRSSETNLR